MITTKKTADAVPGVNSKSAIDPTYRNTDHPAREDTLKPPYLLHLEDGKDPLPEEDLLEDHHPHPPEDLEAPEDPVDLRAQADHEDPVVPIVQEDHLEDLAEVPTPQLASDPDL